MKLLFSAKDVKLIRLSKPSIFDIPLLFSHNATNPVYCEIVSGMIFMNPLYCRYSLSLS